MTLIVPDFLLLGFWGSAWSPSIMTIAKSQRNNAALIAHERCHQLQMRRDGLARFWWDYLMSKPHRIAYEIEAYRVWLVIAPQDRYKVLHWLTHNYGAGLPVHEIETLLNQP